MMTCNAKEKKKQSGHLFISEQRVFKSTSSDSLNLVHSTLGSHSEAGLVPDSKVSISTNRQFYQLSDGAKSFESPALFSRVIASLLILVV